MSRRFNVLAGPLLAAGLCVPPAHLAAGDTRFFELSGTERAILRAEIREVLLSLPRDLLPDVPPPPVDLYAEAVSDDLAQIAAHGATLFGPDAPARSIAFLTRDDCEDCTQALTELRDLAEATGWQVRVIDMAEHADIARALELDTMPSYVLPDMMLRGAMPAIVLEKYLSR